MTNLIKQTITSNTLHQTLRIPRQVYKFSLRSCDKLPKGAKEYYKHCIEQSFKQHVFEPDLLRVQQILEKSLIGAE